MTVETAMRKTRCASRTGTTLRLDWMFAIIALVVGNALVVLTPPFQVADEAQHFFRAYQITQGIFISRELTPAGLGGGTLPSSLFEFWQRFKPMPFHPERGTSRRYILDSFNISLQPERQSLVEFANTAHYFPVSYIPQSLGVAVGRGLALPVPMLLYLGREGNLLVFTLIGFLSLRLAPAIARPMFLFLLMPMMLCLAASVSADTLTDALAVLFTSLVCRYFAAGPDSVGRGALLLLLAVTIPLSVGKIVYITLLGMLVLIPAENFGGKARKVAAVAMLIILNLAVLVAWSAATAKLNGKITSDKGISPHEQIERLERHPTLFATMMGNTARNGGWYTLSSYVAVIGWMDLNFPPPIVVMFLAVMVFACWACGNRLALPPPGVTALIVLPAVTLSFLAFSLLNLLYWTPTDSNFLLGIQGRYFFPLTAPMILLLCSFCRRLPRPSDLPRMQTLLNFSFIMMALMMSGRLLVSIWSRFYA